MSPRNFRAVRRLLGLPLTFVAKGMGVSAPALSQWERTGRGVAEWRVLRAKDAMEQTARIWGRVTD